MPKLYEYFGLIILFYSNEHEPIHVHGRCENRENKAEIILEKGILTGIRITKVRGKRPLSSQELRKFEKVVNHFKQEIIKSWIDFFVYNRVVKSKRITKEIK